MISRRVSCLLEANKRGLRLRYDPSGSANRCYYRCLGKFLNLGEDDLINMLESFMLDNQVIPVENEVSILNTRRFGFFPKFAVNMCF